MRFLFVNQYAPPDPSPTARLLGELAEFLRQNGHEVKVICQRQDYHGRPARGLRRLWREGLALAAMAWAGLRVGRPAPEVVLAWSSPPGALVVATLLARWHRARLAHWAMDLYPELALALGEISPGGLSARVVGAAMRWAYRRASLVVALDEDMRDHLQGLCRVPVRIVPPWSARDIECQADHAAALARDTAVTGTPPGQCVCLYSGNLGRAHEWQTLLESQALLEKWGLPVSLVFQGDGAGRPAAMAHAKTLELQNCQWHGYVAEEELLTALLSARILIVTQRPETRGLLWPSKLALLERLPRPILFVGPEEGAIARSLRARGNAGVFAPGRSEAVARWIEVIVRNGMDWTTAQAPPPPTSAEQASHLQKWLLECGES